MAIFGFVASFFMGLVGIILSAISLKKYKNQEEQKNKGLAVAGLVLSIIRFIAEVCVVALVIILLFVSILSSLLTAMPA